MDIPYIYIYATVKTCLTDMAGNPASFPKQVSQVTLW